MTKNQKRIISIRRYILFQSTALIFFFTLTKKSNPNPDCTFVFIGIFLWIFLQLFCLVSPQLLFQSCSQALMKQRRKRLKRQTDNSHTDKSVHIEAAIVQEPADWWLLPPLSPQEYEEKLAKLQAEYNAEQESKAKLQADITALRCSYESTLFNLEKAHASRGSCDPKNGKKDTSA